MQDMAIQEVEMYEAAPTISDNENRTSENNYREEKAANKIMDNVRMLSFSGEDANFYTRWLNMCEFFCDKRQVPPKWMNATRSDGDLGTRGGEEINGTSDFCILNFWPIKVSKPLSGLALTWGEQYPELYELANAAVRAGFEAAMEMHITLLDMNLSMLGGWLFDYQSVEALKDNPEKGSVGDIEVPTRLTISARLRRKERG
ncbi:hypothetical protein N431DRAFT_440041 [Stipitochalara longipes BDJ]|nr:hypothetical protein N431DRAFT_440041 [Stipitochalara longipes BDJ]